MRKRRGSGFFAGIFVGVLFSMTFFLVMYFLDIQILPTSSLASDIRNRAEIVESYIDSYYWKNDVSDQTISEYANKYSGKKTTASSFPHLSLSSIISKYNLTGSHNFHFS